MGQRSPGDAVFASPPDAAELAPDPVITRVAVDARVTPAPVRTLRADTRSRP
jgi:hypothetical protein